MKSPPKILEAERLILRDASGKIQIELCATAEGPEVSLRGEGEEKRIVLCVSRGGPRVLILDGRGQTVASIEEAGGTGSLLLCDEAGKVVARLGGGTHEKQFYSAKEVAGILRVPLDVVYRLVNERKLPCLPLGRGRRRFARGAVETFLSTHRKPPLDRRNVFAPAPAAGASGPKGPSTPNADLVDKLEFGAAKG